MMKSRSIKAKGKIFEKLIRKKLLEYFPELADEIRITIGQEGGSDLKLTKKAQDILKIKIECKSRAKMALYEWYNQAIKHDGDLEPIVCVKQNRAQPLVIMDLEYYLGLLK